MEFYLCLYGVPHGKQIEAPESAKLYLDTFYAPCTDVLQYRVECVKIDDKPYFFYNYVVYREKGASKNNIVAMDGREGSFIGLSVMMDTYYTNYQNIFSVLDYLYNSEILGTFLKKENLSLKFCKSFDVASRKKIEEKLVQMLTPLFNDKNAFVFSVPNFENKKVELSTSLFDLTDSQVSGHIMKNVVVKLSPYYDSKNTVEIKKHCDEKIKTIEAEKSKLSNELSDKGNQIAKLKSQLSILEGEQKKNQEKREISQIVHEIKEPIKKLSGILGRNEISEYNNGMVGIDDSKDKRGNKKNIGSLILFGLSVVNLIILIGLSILLYGNYSENKSLKESLGEMNNRLQSISSRSKTNHKPVPQKPIYVESTSSADDSNTYDIRDAKEENQSQKIPNTKFRIDIKELRSKSQKLKKGDNYTLSIVNNSQQAGNIPKLNGSFTVKVDGSDISVENNRFSIPKEYNGKQCIITFTSNQLDRPIERVVDIK